MIDCVKPLLVSRGLGRQKVRRSLLPHDDWKQIKVNVCLWRYLSKHLRESKLLHLLLSRLIVADTSQVVEVLAHLIPMRVYLALASLLAIEYVVLVLVQVSPQLLRVSLALDHQGRQSLMIDLLVVLLRLLLFCHLIHLLLLLRTAAVYLSIYSLQCL